MNELNENYITVNTMLSYKKNNGESPEELGDLINLNNDLIKNGKNIPNEILLKNKRNKANFNCRKNNIHYEIINKTKPSQPTKKMIKSNSEVFVKLRSTLNKITEENFDSMVIILISVNINLEDDLLKFCDQLIQKITYEKKFLELYSKLVEELISKINGEINFKDNFMKRCDHIFNDYLDRTSLDDFNDPNFIIKGEITNMAKFYCYIYCKNVIDDNKIDSYIESVLNKKSKTYKLDLICAILKSIQIIDQQMLTNIDKNVLKLYIAECNVDKHNDKINQKENFLIMDMIDIYNKYLN